MRLCNSSILVLCSLLSFVAFPLAASAQPPCHLLTSADPIPPGFGAAYNLFSSEREPLLSVNCDPISDATLRVGNGRNTLFIYKTAYEWTGSNWRELTLSGQNRAGDWYIGSAATNIVRSEAQLAQKNFVVAYTCQWSNNAWKCGCANTFCSTKYWQLQAFSYRSTAGDGGNSAARLRVRQDTTKLEYNGRITRLYGIGLVLGPKYTPTAAQRADYEKENPGKTAHARILDEVNWIRSRMDINWIRMYIAPEEWKDSTPQQFFAFFDPFVERAREQGMFVDFVWWVVGWPDSCAQFNKNPSWKLAMEFSEAMAVHYKNAGNAALTFWDEPTTDCRPGGGVGDMNEWALWQPYAQQAINKIRATGSDILLFVPGGHYGRTFNTWHGKPLSDSKSNFCLSEQGYSRHGEWPKLGRAYLTTKRPDGSTYRVDDKVCLIFGITNASGQTDGKPSIEIYDPRQVNSIWADYLINYAISPEGKWNGVAYWAWSRWADPRMIPAPHNGWPNIAAPRSEFGLANSAKWFRDNIPDDLVRP